MTFKVVAHTLAAAVAAGGTFTISYPDGTSRGDFVGGVHHKISTAQGDYSAPGDFTITLNAADITVTWGAGNAPLGAGLPMHIQLDELGSDDGKPAQIDETVNVRLFPTAHVDLGSPITLDANGLIVAATGAELPNAETVTYTPDNAGASPVDGANQTWELDVPRNVTAAVTHATSVVAMTVTVTGKDVYGATMVEDLAIAATGVSQTADGKKAFASIDSIAFTAAGNAEANTANIGFGDVLGLPVALPNAAYVLAEIENGATAVAGTLVAADSADPTATTGDVRGTYDPNSAADGSKGFALLVALADVEDHGLAQYAG